MEVITVSSRKGGAGKTTTSIHLSVLASTVSEPALLLDADPQGSLIVWHNLRTDANPQLIHVKNWTQIPDLVEEAREAGFRYVIIDTPPHAEDAINTAMRLADIIVTPTRPGLLDLDAVQITLDMAAKLGKTPLTFINHCPPPRSKAPKKEATVTIEARQVLAAKGATVADTAVAQRVPLGHALNGGQTVTEYDPTGEAAKEVMSLWEEITAHLAAKRLEKAA